MTVTVRELIEILAKKDFDSEVFIDLRSKISLTDVFGSKDAHDIRSVSEFRVRGKSVITLNIRK